MSRNTNLRVEIPMSNDKAIISEHDIAEENFLAFRLGQVQDLNDPRTSVEAIQQFLESHAEKEVWVFVHDIQVLVSYGLDKRNSDWLECAGVILWKKPEFFKALLDLGFAAQENEKPHIILNLLDYNSNKCVKALLDHPNTSTAAVFELLENFSTLELNKFIGRMETLIELGLNKTNTRWLESSGVILWKKPEFFKVLLDLDFAYKNPGEQHLIFALLDNNSKECTKYLLEKIGGLDSLIGERDKFNRTFDEVLTNKGLTRESLLSVWVDDTEGASSETAFSASTYQDLESAAEATLDSHDVADSFTYILGRITNPWSSVRDHLHEHLE